MNKPSKRIVSDGILYGCYVWIMPDGRVVMDEEGNYAVSRFCMKGDRRAIEGLRHLMKDVGISVGKPMFLENQRPVSDEQYEEMIMRQKWGLTPDPLDVSEAYDR